ncbi:O-antigen ligase family protein [Corallococcus sp. bb12-1]|uniref:O-antigen ligase family protein n=1 Tax=Corallococcus sp. bb12-1 TaxID=2996784 RepID=UPI00226E4312|nr:O-antigen ligase family protein [Corallococcus sp. bb12-1]MCY1040260.1 O-antigen ligase family protein [Corallococcus sp. bb12-1]
MGALACALAAWQSLSWVASDVSWLGLPRLLDGFAVLALCLALAEGRLPRKAVLWPLVAAGALGAGLGLLEQWVELPGLVQATRPSGFFASRAVAGEYVAASLVLTLGFLPLRRYPWALALMAIQTAFLVSTRSRTGWALAALAVLWVCRQLPVRERRVAWGAMVLAALLAVGLTPGPRLEWQGARPYAESLTSLARMDVGGRLDTWRNSLVMVKEHPWLGVGPGGFATTYPRFHRAVVRDKAFSAGQQIEEPHNEGLRAAIEWGLPGLALGGLFLAVLLRGLPRRPGRRTVSLLGALGVLGLASQVSLTFIAPSTWVLAACLAGLLGRSGRGQGVRVPLPWMRAVPLALALLFASVDFPQARASWRWRQAEVSAQRGHLRRAYEGMQAAAPDAREAAAFIRLTEVARKAGDAPRCAEAAREGLQRAPLSTRLFTLLGECEALQGHGAEAREAYEQGLRILEDDPYALWGLAQLSEGSRRVELMGQVAEAARLEWSLLPPALARREREWLESLAQRAEEERVLSGND